jgi:hypothetical protein
VTSRDVVVLAPMRVILLAAAVLVFLAGFQLTVFPERTADWFAWTIDVPMTAVFLGAAYWSSAVLEVAGARSAGWGRARITVWTVLVFTSLTLVVTLVHLENFHLGPEHPTGLHLLLVLLAAVLGVGGLALLLAPTWAADGWPWPLTELTARAVGAWLVGLGWAAGHARVIDDVARVQPLGMTGVAFVVLELVALARYGDALDWTGGPAVAFLLGLGGIAVVSVWILALGRRRGDGTVRAGDAAARGRTR